MQHILNILFTPFGQIFNTLDTTIEGQNISSNGTDENAIDVSDNATAIVKNSTITRTSSDSTGGDNSSFYGVGAALLARSGNLYVSDSTINTDSASGGTLYAWNLDVTTNGNSSAAIRSDRGGGTMVVDGGTYTSNGIVRPLYIVQQI